MPKFWSGLLLVFSLSSFLPLSAAAEEKMTVAIGVDKPPNSFVQNGELTGAEHDIFMEAGKRLGIQFSFEIMSNNRLMASLESHLVDAASAVPPDVDRPNAYFSDTLLKIDNVVVAKAGRHLQLEKIDDLKGKTFVTWQGGWHDLGDEFRALYRPDPVSGKFPPGYNEVVSQYTQNFMFWNDRIDLIVISFDIFNWYRRELSGKVDASAPVAVYHLFKPTLIRAAFRTPEMRDRFNKTLREMHRDGAYKAILAKYAMSE